MAGRGIVITGSTRGIGRGLARAFLDLGCRVVVSGRDAAAVARSAAELSRGAAEGRVAAVPCDVTRHTDVQGLWERSREFLGTVDIWINNAGVGQGQVMLWELDPDLIDALVRTNLLGAMYGMRVAAAGMLAQGGGAIYNMEGFGSDGRILPGLGGYGATKRGLAFLTDSLARELRATPVIACAIRPGMVVTDLITRPYEGRPAQWEKVSPIFRILADRVETVMPWVARRVLANRRNGARICWLTNAKASWRFATAWLSRRDPFAAPGTAAG